MVRQVRMRGPARDAVSARHREHPSTIPRGRREPFCVSRISPFPVCVSRISRRTGPGSAGSPREVRQSSRPLAPRIATIAIRSSLASPAPRPRERIVFGVYALWPDFRSAVWTYPTDAGVLQRLSKQKRELASVHTSGSALRGRADVALALNRWANGWQNVLMGAFNAGFRDGQGAT